MMLSGIWMQSIGISPLSSDKLLTYLILLLNFELEKRKEKRYQSLLHPLSGCCLFLKILITLSQHSY